MTLNLSLFLSLSSRLVSLRTRKYRRFKIAGATSPTPRPHACARAAVPVCFSFFCFSLYTCVLPGALTICFFGPFFGDTALPTAMPVAVEVAFFAILRFFLSLAPFGRPLPFFRFTLSFDPFGRPRPRFTTTGFATATASVETAAAAPAAERDMLLMREREGGSESGRRGRERERREERGECEGSENVLWRVWSGGRGEATRHGADGARRRTHRTGIGAQREGSTEGA